MFKRYELRDFRFRLLLYVYTLTVLGILLIGSADKSYQNKQVVGMALGSFVMHAWTIPGF